MPEQLPLVAPVAKVRPRNVDPKAAAKIAIQRRAKPSAVPGHVRLVLTLDLPRELAKRLSAKGIRSRVPPLARPLPSIPSTTGCAVLFGDFCRYSRPVRRPVIVHHRRVSLGLPEAAPDAIRHGRPLALPVL